MARFVVSSIYAIFLISVKYSIATNSSELLNYLHESSNYVELAYRDLGDLKFTDIEEFECNLNSTTTELLNKEFKNLTAEIDEAKNQIGNFASSYCDKKSKGFLLEAYIQSLNKSVNTFSSNCSYVLQDDQAELDNLSGNITYLTKEVKNCSEDEDCLNKLGPVVLAFAANVNNDTKKATAKAYEKVENYQTVLKQLSSLLVKRLMDDGNNTKSCYDELLNVKSAIVSLNGTTKLYANSSKEQLDTNMQEVKSFKNVAIIAFDKALQQEMDKNDAILKVYEEKADNKGKNVTNCTENRSIYNVYYQQYSELFMKVLRNFINESLIIKQNGEANIDTVATAGDALYSQLKKCNNDTCISQISNQAKTAADEGAQTIIEQVVKLNSYINDKEDEIRKSVSTTSLINFSSHLKNATDKMLECIFVKLGYETISDLENKVSNSDLRIQNTIRDLQDMSTAASSLADQIIFKSKSELETYLLLQVANITTYEALAKSHKLTEKITKCLDNKSKIIDKLLPEVIDEIDKAYTEKIKLLKDYIQTEEEYVEGLKSVIENLREEIGTCDVTEVQCINDVKETCDQDLSSLNENINHVSSNTTKSVTDFNVTVSADVEKIKNDGFASAKKMSLTSTSCIQDEIDNAGQMSLPSVSLLVFIFSLLGLLSK